jgi:DUF4097 and DUF4098 domain-containing protein YvlB
MNQDNDLETQIEALRNETPEQRKKRLAYPRMLTEAEIEFLRRDTKESHLKIKTALATIGVPKI